MLLDEKDVAKIRFMLRLTSKVLDDQTIQRHGILDRLKTLESVEHYKPTLSDLITYRTSTSFVMSVISREPNSRKKRSSLKILGKLSEKLFDAINIVASNEDS